MDYYILDDSIETIEWEDIVKAKHLDPTKTYQKLLTEINKYLDPHYILDLNFDYESMILLINQAKEYNIPFVNSNDLLASFILTNKDINIKRRLLVEEGFLKGKKAASVLDPHLYKKLCRNLEQENDISEIRKYRKHFIKEVLNNDFFALELMISPEEYFRDHNYYFDDHSKPIDKYTAADIYYLDLIADYFFDDYFNNVFIDIRQIIKYVNLTNSETVSQIRLDFYQSFIDLKDKTPEERREFFNTFKEVDIQEQFYEDIRKLKDESYKSLVDSCTQFTKSSPLYNKDLSDKYGCEVYYLDGEEFYGFVRSDSRISKYDVDFSSDKPTLVEKPQPTKEQIARLGASFTYIGKDDIQTFQHPNQKLTMLYRGIDYRTIGHVYHNDSWSSPSYYHYSDYANELHTPASLIQESTKYPEILITDLQGVEPFAIICLDQITEWDVKFSKQNNMPIVLINSLKYERKYQPDDFFENQYTR